MVIRHVYARSWRGRSGGLPNTATVLILSLCLNGLLSLALLLVAYQSYGSSSLLSVTPMKWNGGHPLDKKSGNCYCGGVDNYCMCTPSLAIDLVIVSGDDHIWLVRRKDTNQLATMGGFVMVGETVEETVKRELHEETGIVLKTPPILLGVYSDPRRDNRRHTTSAVYAIHLDGNENPVAADDIKEVKRIPMADIEKYEYFADHQTILLDYRRWHLQREKDPRIQHKDLFQPTQLRGYKNDVAPNIQRSVCG